MLIKEKNIYNFFLLFLLCHVFIWTLVPSLSNNNLPLDTIEALAWGSDLKFGYTKHPPVSAWVAELFYKIFGSQDWSYYLLSQICTVFSFFIVFKFSEDFFKNKKLSLISVLLLEGIYFYNFTTPEFNVNICLLPFWSLAVLYCWKGFKDNKTIDWLLLGLFAALGLLSKYLFIYLGIAMDIFFLYMIIKKKINFKCLVSLVSFFIVLIPHLLWLSENNYSTLGYAFHRTGVEEVVLLDHLINPIIFLGKQLGILVPFFIMLLFIINKFKIKFGLNLKDNKFLFLLAINFVPLVLIFLTSLFTGAKIRTMWMTPFYLFMGIFVVYILQSKIDLNKLKYFFSIFLFLFLFSPSLYLYISISQKDKRTDYPGKEISQLVQNRWNKNFNNKISLIVGDEWYGGNLSYHLKSRPKWVNEMGSHLQNLNLDGGIIYIGNPDVLKTVCPGIFGKIKSQGICMIGNR